MGNEIIRCRLTLNAQIRSESLQPLGIEVWVEGAGRIQPLPGGVSPRIKGHPPRALWIFM